jgi:hypothetical protein
MRKQRASEARAARRNDRPTPISERSKRFYSSGYRTAIFFDKCPEEIEADCIVGMIHVGDNSLKQ